MLISIAVVAVCVLAYTQLRRSDSPSSTIEITGFVSNCSNGGEVRMPGVNVYAYRLNSVPQIEASLKEMNDASATAFFEYYSELQTLIENTPAAVHAQTDTNGTYRLDSLRLNDRYLVLMIGHLESEPAFFDYKETEQLTSGRHTIDFSMPCGSQ